jgi:hypothetical protein
MRQQARHILTVSSLALLLLGACSSGGDSDPKPAVAGAAGFGSEEVSCLEDARVSDFSRGLTATGPNGFTVTIESGDPEPPARGDNTWNVTVLDAAGEPFQAAELTPSARMPDHGHMSPTTPMASATDEEGHATLSGLNLFMAGVWVIDVKISAADADEPVDSVSFAFCVEG